MRLYTRSGDDGTTGLFGGGRVPKDDPRMQAIGAIDETNAALGLCLCAMTEPGGTASASIRAILTTLQSRLFDLGADLATPLDSPHAGKIARISAEQVAQAERWIDEIDGGNSPMTQFILPGGTEAAARLHLARTICRRAEREMVALGRVQSINPQTIVFVNRLSDLLFAMARRVK